MSLPRKYTRVAVMLHWSMAMLIVANIVLGWSANWVPDASVRPLIDTHKSIGITVLGLGLMRLLWRVAHSPPPLPPSYRSWERTASHVAHGALYVLIVSLPVSGWMHDSAWKDAASHPMRWFGLFSWPRIEAISGVEPVLKEHLHSLFGTVHAWLGYVLYALVTLHIVAALKHQFADKERELQRMSW